MEGPLACLANAKVIGRGKEMTTFRARNSKRARSFWELCTSPPLKHDLILPPHVTTDLQYMIRHLHLAHRIRRHGMVLFAVASSTGYPYRTGLRQALKWVLGCMNLFPVVRGGIHATWGLPFSPYLYMVHNLIIPIM